MSPITRIPIILSALSAAALPALTSASDIPLPLSGVQGGLIVHVGCGDGTQTSAMRANDAFLVQGLDTDPARVAQAPVAAQEHARHPAAPPRGRGGRRLRPSGFAPTGA